MRMLKLPTNISEDVFEPVYPATWITMGSRKSQASASEGFLRILGPTSLSSDHKAELLPVASVAESCKRQQLIHKEKASLSSS